MDANVHVIQPFRALPAPRERREREPKKRFELAVSGETRADGAETPLEGAHAPIAGEHEDGVGEHVDVVA